MSRHARGLRGRMACCIKTAKRKISKTTPRDSPGTPVFGAKDLFEIPMGPHPMGATHAGGLGKYCVF